MNSLLEKLWCSFNSKKHLFLATEKVGAFSEKYMLNNSNDKRINSDVVYDCMFVKCYY